jgi:hypothetical protein
VKLTCCVDMHVDGGTDISMLVAQFLQQQYPQNKFKITPVMLSIAVSQRDLEHYKQTYPNVLFIAHCPLIPLST